MRKETRRKQEWELTIPERIVRAGWWKGTLESFYDLPTKEREKIAFEATGCEVAAPTWEAPVDCCHVGCQIRRGEKHPVYATNCILRGEAYRGWLRFADRTAKAKTFRAVRKACKATGIFDPWELPGGWQALVYTGVLS